MKNFRATLPFSIAVLSLTSTGFTTVAFARAQDTDNDAIVAAKKAALVVEGKGVVPVVPTAFFVTVEVNSEGKGLDRLKTENEQNSEALRAALTRQGIQASKPRPLTTLRRSSSEGYTDVTNTPNPLAYPDDVFKVVRSFSFSTSTPAKIQQALAAMRTLNLPARAEVLSALAETKEETAARRAALKAAVADAKDQAQVFGDAAKPRTFELVFAREGEFQSPSEKTYVALDSREPLPAFDSITAATDVTVFYGLTPTTPPAPAKPAKVAVAPAAAKATTKTKGKTP